ncbi:uncharacterized protein TNCV_442991 [Trichonephila clavipes]|nr:uncharacterized protein TNCV_442991 [Trichonephila clavipes]
MRHYMKERGLVMGRIGHTQESPEVLGDLGGREKRSFQGSKHGDQKRPTPVLPQGIKRTVPSSVASRNNKYRRNNNPSQGPESIAGLSHQQMIRQFNLPTEESRREARVQYDKTRETRTTGARRNTRGAEEHWDRQSTAEQSQEKEPRHESLRRRSGG